MNAHVCLQMNECMDAANKGIMYEAPINRDGVKADEVPHTVHQLHDELKHKHGLVEHAAGGVGALVHRCVSVALMVHANRVYGVVRRGAAHLCDAPQVGQAARRCQHATAGSKAFAIVKHCRITN